MSHYRYKNSVCIDAVYGLIRRHVLTPANIHESQMLPAVLDGENEGSMVWADSAEQGRLLKRMIEEAGYESRIQEKESRQHPLGEAAKARNRERAKRALEWSTSLVR